jgi:hypothetical protein
MEIVVEYDCTIWCHIATCLQQFDIETQIIVEPLDLGTLELGVSGSMASTEEIAMRLLKVKLSLL